MKLHTQASFAMSPPHVTYYNASRGAPSVTPHGATGHPFRRVCSTKHRRVGLSTRHSNLVIAASKSEHSDGERVEARVRSSRRGVLMAPFLLAGVSVLLSASASARAEDKVDELTAPKLAESPAPKQEEEEEEVITSRIYDATVIGEPLAIGKEKGKVWKKLMNARVVYLGEAEQVPVRDDKELELEIVKNLHRRCLENDKRLSLALEAFPSNLQEPLNQYIDKKIDGETLKSYTIHWPSQRWQEYEPILSYCLENGIRLVACGTPLKILRTVQAEGIRGLTKDERKLYAPPAGSGFISGFPSISRRSSVDTTQNLSIPFGPSSYLSAQAKVVDEHSMSQIILQNVLDERDIDMLIVVTGASHVTYGSRGTGVPARISGKIKKNQVVILLDPERQFIRREGQVPVADFLWYSAARPCSRNCFDRAEIARVMSAAGQRRDALPKDLQKGIDLGLVSPEVLQNFFDLEQYPLISGLTHRFQGVRERLLADPKFLHRLAIEETISITTVLLAQYEKRKENFFQEIDYVITDAVRAVVVDFFTVWLPAPTLSFLSYADEMKAPDNIGSLMGLLGSIPDNAFQKNPAGTNWNLNHRVASVVFGGLKLACVGFISSLGAVASSNSLYAIRKFLSPEVATPQQIPVIKSAVVYAGFLGISANFRYQVIAGIVEHRISEQFSSQTFFVNMLSLVARIINSYWGAQQWIDIARATGLQVKKTESPTSDSLNHTAILCNKTEEASIQEINNK